MAPVKPRVIVTRKLPAGVEARMRALFDVRLNESDTPFDANAMRQAVQEADVLVPTVTDKVGHDIIAAAGPQLKLIANFGVGYNHIDVAAAGKKGIAVSNTPGVLTDATADIAMALLLSVTRRVVEAAKCLESGGFESWSPTFMLGVGLRGKALGLVGMGRIGEATARRAKAFGMAIHYHNRKKAAPEIEQELGAKYWPDLDAMLAQMDIVSIHCPYTPETYHLFSAARLARMKPSAFLINTARGEIVEEKALAEALEQGGLAGCGLDVYENEPKVEPKLFGLKNAVLLPHLGSGTVETRTAMGEKVIANIEAFIARRELPDPVKAPL